MKYDDASWHYGGDFPEELSKQAGGTHIGMFLTWCLLNGLSGKIHLEDASDDLDKLKNRSETPGQWFCNYCDEKFIDEDLSDEGNLFAEYYYASDDAPYVEDYINILGSNLESIYYVPDSWECFDAIAPLISQRFKIWKRNNG